jgi:hypothetical protein
LEPAGQSSVANSPPFRPLQVRRQMRWPERTARPQPEASKHSARRPAAQRATPVAAPDLRRWLKPLLVKKPSRSMKPPVVTLPAMQEPPRVTSRLRVQPWTGSWRCAKLS